MSRIWTQQPQVPVGIDWGNPITKGLWFAQEASVGQRNIVDSVAATASLGSPVASQYGVAQAFTTTGSSFGSPTTLTGATQATWEVMFKTSSVASAFSLFHQWDTQKWLIQINGTGLVWVAAQNGGGRLRWDGTSLFTANTWHHLILSWLGGTTYLAYVNGVPKTLSFVEAVSSIGNAVTPLKFGAFNASGQVVFARSWTRGLNATECKSLSNNPWQIFQPLPSRIFVGIPASGSPTLYPSLYTNTSELYSPTVTGTSSSQSVTANLLDNSGTAGAVYSPTVTRGAVSISPSLLDAGNSVYSPAVNTGSVLVSPAYFENPNSVYAPTVSAGSVNVSPSIYENISVVESPLVLTDGNNIYANLLDNSFNNSVYQPSAVVGSVVISPAYFENAEEIYSSLVSSGRILSPAYFENPNSVYNCNVDPGSISIYPGLHTNLSSVYSPTIGGAADLQSIVSTFLDNTGSGIGSISGTPEEVAAILLAAIRADPQILTVHKFLALSK